MNEFAETVLAQIKARSPLALMEWGCRSIVYSERRVAFDVVPPGRHRKVRVVVELDPDDTYSVIIGRVVKLDWRVLSANDGVYCDVLYDCIARRLKEIAA